MRMLVDRLIKDALQYSAEYGDQLANHLPMALSALARLDSPDSRLQEFANVYAQRLRPLEPPREDVRRDNWKSWLGRHSHNADYRTFFRNEIESMGIPGTLKEFLPVLLPGIGGGAFHALIRLGYAVERKDPDETAEALAYWAMARLPLGEGSASEPRSEDPLELLNDIARDEQLTDNSRAAGNIFQRMEIVSQKKEFAGVIDRLSVTESAPDRLADASLNLYLATESFTALHTVTAMHAFRMIRPHWPDEKSALRYLWQAIAAAYITIGAPKVPPAKKAPVPPWPAIKAAAVRSDDDHVIKMVYTCFKEWERSSDSRYQLVAGNRARVSAS